jgi:hypothetical protein
MEKQEDKPMKRLAIFLLAAVLLMGLLCGCGGNSGSTDSQMAVAAYDEAATQSYGSSTIYDTAVFPDDSQAKIIYTADLTLETTDFDGAVSSLGVLTQELGGYYEASSIYQWGDGYREASYTVRVPVEQYQNFLTQAGSICHLLRSNEYADDISDTYYDTDGRLQTQETKLARLQELLAQAESVEDIITIESAISETEEYIESLSGQLRRYDSQVAYATVSIELNEVYKMSNVAEAPIGFASRLGTAFSSGWQGFVNSLEQLVIALAYSWMWLIVAVFIVVVVVLLRKRRKARKKPEDERK